MDGRRTISAVASTTGFSPSTLRFYEDAGLITPDRTTSGYRVYDDRAVERLRFIARAKHLGLRLGEITELMQLWDGDECAPVAGRLRELIDDKLVETRARITEMVSFAGELRRFRTALSLEDTTGACGDACACHAAAQPPGVSLGATPAVTAPPVACTLERSHLPERIGEWQHILSRADSSTTAVEGGVSVHFPAAPALAAEVAALAAAEQSCCSFFTFTVRIDHAGTELTVTAPEEAAPLVTALFGAAV